MLAYEQIVTIVFTIINLLVLAAFVWLIMKRGGIARLKDAMADQERVVTTLQDEQRSLVQLHATMKQEIADQQALCVHLSEHVDVWQKSFTEQQAARKKQRAERHNMLKDRWKKQQRGYNQLLLRKHAAPRVLEQTHKELVHSFADESLRKAYLDSVVSKLTKG